LACRKDSSQFFTDIRPWRRIGTSCCAGKLVSKLFAKINDMLEGGDNLVFILIDEVRLGNCMHVHTHVFILIDEVRLGRRMHAGRVFPAVGLWMHTNCMHSCIVDVRYSKRQLVPDPVHSTPKSSAACMRPQVESLAAARQAGAGEPADSVRAVNALLTQLDALKSYSNVMVCSCVLPVCPAARALSCPKARRWSQRRRCGHSSN